MNIAYVICSGMAGFFVFDCYRIYATSTSKSTFVTLRSWKGLFAHIIVYAAAGVLGLFVNLDMLLIGIPSSAAEPSSATPLLIATMLRAFFLGSLGPAGLSKSQPPGGNGSPSSTGELRVEDLAVRPAGFSDYICHLLMR